MVSAIVAVDAHISAVGLRLRKAVPRGRDHLLLELADLDGRLLTGQWHRDPRRAAEVATKTREVCGHVSAWALGDTGIVLQRDGADRRLPALHEIARRPAAQLVAHRAERRGVVRRADGDYTKVVRPGRARDVVAALHSVDVPGLAVPRVRAVDERLGIVCTTALPGHTLHELLGASTCTDEELTGLLRSVGAGVRSLHHGTPRAAAPHDAAAELAVTRGWVQTATAYGLLPEDAWRPGLDRAAGLLAAAPATWVRVHRDLHDKQLLLAAGRPVGLLDLDLSTVGEPALDLANLLTHLELRWLQGRCGRDRFLACADALLAGYAADLRLRRRLPGYLLSTRLRLAGVYAFRAADPELIRSLLDPAHDKELVS